MELGNIKISQSSLLLNEIQLVFLHTVLQTAASLLLLPRETKKVDLDIF